MNITNIIDLLYAVLEETLWTFKEKYNGFRGYTLKISFSEIEMGPIFKIYRYYSNLTKYW